MDMFGSASISWSGEPPPQPESTVDVTSSEQEDSTDTPPNAAQYARSSAPAGDPQLLPLRKGVTGGSSMGLDGSLPSSPSSPSFAAVMRNYRRSYSQVGLKSALGLHQYDFVRECENTTSGAQQGCSPRKLQGPATPQDTRASFVPTSPISPMATTEFLSGPCAPNLHAIFHASASAPGAMHNHLDSFGGSMHGGLYRDSTMFATQDVVDVLRSSTSGMDRALSLSGKSPNHDHLQQVDAILTSMTTEVPEVSNTIVLSEHLPAAMQRAKWSVKDFHLQRQVHKGYASDVYEATCKKTSRKVALKVYSVEQLDDIPRVQLAREIRLHSMCHHPNIVQFYAAFVEDLSINSKGKEQPSTCRAVVIVVEWAGRGNLLRFMKAQGGFLSEAKAVNLVILPMLTSLQYLHTQGIVHRDLKPENIIFDENMVLKMADFGLALDLKEERANTRAGTLDYMAPEVLLCPTKASPADFKFESGARHYTTGADAWAVGVILYELLTGQPPFKSKSTTSTARSIVACDLRFPDQISEVARSLIRACLKVDPTERPTVVELIEHELLCTMKKRASYGVAARRNNTFVEYIHQQQREKERMHRMSELKHSNTTTWLQTIASGATEDDDEAEGDDTLNTLTRMYSAVG